MKVFYSQVSHPQRPMPIGLSTIYIINGDASYDVVRDWDVNPNAYIAIRTVEGDGVIKIKEQNVFHLNQDSLMIVQNHFIESYKCKGDIWNFIWFEFYTDGEIEMPVNTVIYKKMSNWELTESYECLDLLKVDNNYTKILASSRFSSVYYSWLQANMLSSSKHSEYNKQIQNLIIYIKTNLDKPVSFKTLADKVGLTERRFRDVFKDITGYTPKKYYDLCRIEAAEMLLKTSSLSINEISQRLSYYNQFHFSKAFAKAKGKSPLKYRNNT